MSSIEAAKATIRQEILGLEVRLSALKEACAALDRVNANARTPSNVVQLRPALDKRAPTLKQAIITALMSANGPIHVTELWEMVLQQGVSSKAREPLNVLDTVIGHLRKSNEPIVNRGGRMYEWTGNRVVNG